MTLHIAVDMDGVLLDMVAGIRTAIKAEYDVDLDPEDVDEYDLHPLLDPILGRSWWDWLRERDWLWPNFPAVPGAVGAIDAMRRDGHYVEIVTSKPEWAEFVVWKWLGKWRPAANAVTIVHSGSEKPFASDADLLIDDDPSNCEAWIASHPNRVALLFSQHYNRNARTGGGVTRAVNWRHALDLVEHWDSALEYVEDLH